MRLILEFDKFKPEYRPIRLFKKDSYLVNFDENKTEEKEKLVRSTKSDDHWAITVSAALYPPITINTVPGSKPSMANNFLIILVLSRSLDVKIRRIQISLAILSRLSRHSVVLFVQYVRFLMSLGV